jgi:hypothetical protein
MKSPLRLPAVSLALALQQRLRHAIRSRALIFAATAMLAVAGVRRVQAIAIQIDLGNPGTLSNDLAVAFNGLNGTSLLGQTLSLDFTFTNQEFVRIFTVTSDSFIAGLNLQTDGSGLVGFLQGTGYLLDAQGNAIPGFGVTGSASGDDASMFIGLFPLLKDSNGTPNDQLHRPFDFYGVHYDLTFPSNPSVAVTAGQFRLLSDTGPFGIGPGLPTDIRPAPDMGSTLLLLGFGLIALMGMRIRIASAA